MQHLADWITHYGALGAFLAAFTEEVIVPIPSALVMLSAGFFILGAQAISGASLLALLTQVAIPVALGLTLGSLVTYGLAYRLGKPAIERWGRYVGVSWLEIEQLQGRFHRGRADELVFFGLRLVPVIPSVVINIFSGLTRLPVTRYILLTFFGIVVRAYVVSFFGWQIGGAFYKYSQYFNKLEDLGLIILLAILVFFWWRKKHGKK
ncbi:MAG: VTT domain-containing protein [Patescibacteria group bacterium]